MLRNGVSVDSYSALFALKASSRLSDPSTVCQLHAHLCKNGLNSHLYVGTALLGSYVYSSLDAAVHLFDEMPERNVVTWNTMITAYSKSGKVERAREVFDFMLTRDLSSWSAMIAGYMDNGNYSQGLALFRQMVSHEMLMPDEMSLMTLLSECTRRGLAGLLGKSIHAYVQKNGWPLNVALGTALVDMYTKSGFLQYAMQIFKTMKERNVMTWSAMICGLALHGYGHRALSMFEKMKEANVQPNEITFTGILNACKYTGLVDLGRKNFISMIADYGLEPRIQHYGCMVDLLGRAGLLDEAYEFIETMKLEPNIVVWSSFLAACKTHGRFDMVDRALKPVMLLAKPDRDGGVYTLISDLYALRSKWEDVEQMRKSMLKDNVKKVGGSSFIHMIQPIAIT
ncbi:pentatricopeptide repeat-containing protein At2g20540-like [Aristolochia californica]|uniref:pentatricopeptide repeat-containing protein At2g20540-like n=1 Tax=Aristolochia californica TaxID=171875 RepID=UPI0035D8B216